MNASLYKKVKNKVKGYYKKVKNKVKATPTYVKIRRVGDKLAGPILRALLACFGVIGPIWSFLFIKTPDPNDSSETRNEIS